MIIQYDTDSTEALAASAAPGLKNILIQGSDTFISTGEDYVDPATAPGMDRIQVAQP